MSKKILVDKAWYDKALVLMTERENSLKEQTAFIEGLQMFMCTVLTPEQQVQLQKEVANWVNAYEGEIK
ncbi:putative coil containing protein [Vibrio phage 424E50-1]|nr:putative coil containing protein [Vibrio phage 424E50-1]